MRIKEKKSYLSLLNNMVVAIGSLGVFLMILEGSFRIMDIRPKYYRERELRYPKGQAYRESSIPGMLFEHTPNSTIVFCYDDHSENYFDRNGCIENYINAQGLRDTEYTFRQAHNVYRILGLGDSFTFGTGVRLEDTYLKQLESRLNSFSHVKRYEVINSGVSGYNTCQESAYLKHKGLQYNPDMVIIGFVLNDATEMGTIPLIFAKAHTEAMNNSRFPILGILRKYSQVFDFFWYRSERTFKTRKYVAEYNANYLGSQKKREYWDKTKQCLADIATIARERKIDLLLVIFPIFVQLNEQYPFKDIHSLTKETCKQYDIPVLDLFEAYKSMEDSSLWVHPTDQHPNSLAHTIAADAIYRMLKSSNTGQ